MLTTTGVLVYVREKRGPWVQLKGYVGGLSFGMTSSKEALDDSDDGIDRAIKGNAAGAESAIACYLIDHDPGQELLRALSSPFSDGEGGVRMVYPQGAVISADGIFTGLAENPADPDAYQGFTASFTQMEPETRT